MDKMFEMVFGKWVIQVRKDVRRICFIKFTNINTGLSFKFRSSNQTPYMTFGEVGQISDDIGANLPTEFIKQCIREFNENEA
jgi:hypothetical protein